MTRILITGASGLLGVNLALEAAKKYEVVGQTNTQSLFDPGFNTLEADLLQQGEVERVLDESKADWLINCVALTNLDSSEKQPELAQQLNAEIPGRLAAQAAKRDIRFLHVSTDAVFDGIKGDYDEEDAPSPINVYSRTKRIAELAQKVETGLGEDTPVQLKNSPALRALYNNLRGGVGTPERTDRVVEEPGEYAVSGDSAVDLALNIDAAVKRVRPDDWRGIQTREQVIKAALYEILQDEAEVERIFLIIKAQGEY